MDAVLTRAVQAQSRNTGCGKALLANSGKHLPHMTKSSDAGSEMELAEAHPPSEIKAKAKRLRKRGPNLTYSQVETIRTYFERGMVNSLPETLEDRMTVMRLTGLSLHRVDVNTHTSHALRTY
jgi:hypothetical protein